MATFVGQVSNTKTYCKRFTVLIMYKLSYVSAITLLESEHYVEMDNISVLPQVGDIIHFYGNGSPVKVVERHIHFYLQNDRIIEHWKLHVK
jgi:hypothetical protein